MTYNPHAHETMEEFASAIDDALNQRAVSSTDTRVFARIVQSHLASNATITSALFAALNDPVSNFRETLFADANVAYDVTSDSLIVEYERTTIALSVRQNCHHYDPQPSPVGLLVQTDGKAFFVAKWRAPPLRPEIIIASRASKLAETVAFHGSLVAALHPTHFSIIIQTIALTFPRLRGERLFSARHQSEDARSAEKLARAHLQCFQTPEADLLNLEEFCAAQSASSSHPTLQATYADGEYMFRQYGTARSPLFDFGTSEEAVTRDDFATTYRVRDEEFFREFVVAPKHWRPGSRELRLAAFDVLNMLAIRRTKLFRAAFARRVYNVLFPPFYVVRTDTSIRYAVFPCLNMYRDAESSFRRTASVSFMVLPAAQEISPPGTRARPIAFDELYALKDALAKNVFHSSSSSKLYSAWEAVPGYYGALPGQVQLGQILHKVAEAIAAKAYKPTEAASKNNAIAQMMLSARLEARLTTALILVDWSAPSGYSQPWERWLTGADDEVFSDALYRAMFYKDFLSPSTAYASRRVAQFRELNVGNTLGADMTGMTLFNPQDNLKLCIYPKQFEAYPNYSMVRWAVWQVYIDSALSSLRALIHKFQPLMDRSSDLHGIIDTLKQMIREFVEFYDLDIREFIYRKEYEKLRAQMQVDADYKQLLDKFSSAKEDELLREQRLINKLIVSLTIATVTVTVVSTLAQMGRLTTTQYLAIAFAAASVFVWLGYVLFDPLKRVQGRLTKLLKFLRRRR